MQRWTPALRFIWFGACAPFNFSLADPIVHLIISDMLAHRGVPCSSLSILWAIQISNHCEFLWDTTVHAQTTAMVPLILHWIDLGGGHPSEVNYLSLVKKMPILLECHTRGHTDFSYRVMSYELNILWNPLLWLACLLCVLQSKAMLWHTAMVHSCLLWKVNKPAGIDGLKPDGWWCPACVIAEATL